VLPVSPGEIHRDGPGSRLTGLDGSGEFPDVLVASLLIWIHSSLV
jgi:hypothetical protein